MKVLAVIEDDPGMRVLIQEALSDDPRLELSGEAATLQEAVEIARATTPDLIILDHFIEGAVMGLEAAPTLKEVSPGSKILLFTSHDLEVEADREPAIDGFLLKKELHRLLEVSCALLGLGD